MRNYIRKDDNKLLDHIKVNKQTTDQIFPISIKLKPKWIASLLYKQNGSDIIPHKAFFNFKSNRDSMVSSYSSSDQIMNEYGNLIYGTDMKTPFVGKSYEFETVDYRNVGNKVRDWASIVYQNRSKTFFTPFPDPSAFVGGEASYVLSKKFPAYYAYAFEDVTLNNKYTKWYFINATPQVEQFDSSNNFQLERCELSDGVAKVELYDSIYAPVSGVYNSIVYNNIKNLAAIPRKLSLKIDESSTRHELRIDQEYTYINSQSEDEPVIFFNQIFDQQWLSWECDDFGPKTFDEGGDHSKLQECFFERVNFNGLKYPSSARFSRNYSDMSNKKSFKGGTVFKSKLKHQNEHDDQSTILYNACSKMIYSDPLYGEYYVKYHWAGDPEQDQMIDGIDVMGEYNKRTVSICLTEPYHSTTPINHGEFAQYSIVDQVGEPYTYDDNNMYMKFRVSYPMYKEITGILNSPKYNDDIIQTITIRSTPFIIDDLPVDPTDKYKDFKNGISGDKNRKNLGVDDLVGGPVGEGKYYGFYIPTSDSRYSDGRMKISSISQLDRQVFYGEGDANPQTVAEMKIYVNNFSPTSSPLYNNSTPETNEEVEFLDLNNYSEGEDYTISNYEKLHPMIKISGVQGYVKIIEILNNPVKIIKTNKYVEFHARVETPYCIGMNDFRKNSNFKDENNRIVWKKSQIVKTKNYIKAGSNIVIDGKTENRNRRFVPGGEDLITAYKVLLNRNNTTDRVVGDENKTITYPEHTVWWSAGKSWANFQRPIEEEYNKWGTLNIRFASYPGPREVPFINPDRDAKLMLYSNNQKWKFGDKYLSYIERENPQFIYEMDISTLFNKNNKHQVKNYGIPDDKQYFFASVKGNLEVREGEVETPVYDSSFSQLQKDILANMKSDMKLEYWDFQENKWIRFMQTSFSSHKKNKVDLVDNLFIVNSSVFSSNNPTELINDPSTFLKVTLGYFNSETLIFEMPQNGLDLSGKTNLCLYDKERNKTYHISNVRSTIYDEFGASDQENALEIIVEDIDGDLVIQDETAIDPSNIPPNWSAPLSICSAEQIKSGISNYQFNSQVSNPDSFETICLSIISNPSSYNSENKVYLRFSADLDAEYRIGDKEIQYVGPDLDNSSLTDLEKKYTNFPWGDGTTFDSVFDYSKINIKELIKCINAHYISLNNVY